LCRRGMNTFFVIVKSPMPGAGTPKHENKRADNNPNWLTLIINNQLFIINY